MKRKMGGGGGGAEKGGLRSLRLMKLVGLLKEWRSRKRKDSEGLKETIGGKTDPEGTIEPKVLEKCSPGWFNQRGKGEAPSAMPRKSWKGKSKPKGDL